MEKELLFNRQTIQNRIGELADQISSDYEGREPILVGVLNGVIFFFADLTRAIDVPTKMDFIRATSYGSNMASSGKITITKDLEIPVQGKPVVLIEDIVDTGATLGFIRDRLLKRGVESLKICALIDKRERRRTAVFIDYCGFQVAEGFLVGYGLDYDEKYRYLPDIYTLRQ